MAVDLIYSWSFLKVLGHFSSFLCIIFQFFICETKSENGMEIAHFLRDNFVENSSSEPNVPSGCPKFLFPLTESLLMAGKSVFLMEKMKSRTFSEPSPFLELKKGEECFNESGPELRSETEEIKTKDEELSEVFLRRLALNLGIWGESESNLFEEIEENLGNLGNEDVEIREIIFGENNELEENFWLKMIKMAENRPYLSEGKSEDLGELEGGKKGNIILEETKIDDFLSDIFFALMPKREENERKSIKEKSKSQDFTSLKSLLFCGNEKILEVIFGSYC